MHLSDGTHSYFVKLNRAELLPMFEAEAAGLAELAASGTLRVPRPLCTGSPGARPTWPWSTSTSAVAPQRGAAQAGRLLAAMHRTTRATVRLGARQHHRLDAAAQYPGLGLGALLGRTAPGALSSTWPPATATAAPCSASGEALLARLPALLGHAPAASLLHGDLWGGNLAFARSGEPVIFDPAVYYGDREADLAMTELFGGFGGDFYAAYREAWPLDAGYATRRDLYNLYHVLNHLNLFGGGYLGQAQDTHGAAPGPGPLSRRTRAVASQAPGCRPERNRFDPKEILMASR